MKTLSRIVLAASPLITFTFYLCLISGASWLLLVHELQLIDISYGEYIINAFSVFAVIAIIDLCFNSGDGASGYIKAFAYYLLVTFALFTTLEHPALAPAPIVSENINNSSLPVYTLGIQ